MDEMSIKAIKAKSDESVFEELARENTNFLLSIAYNTTGHYTTKSDDEWSVVLMAFHEAVMTYDKSRGEFKGFAAVVVKRRLLDHIRKRERFLEEIPVSPQVFTSDISGDEPSGSTDIETAAAIAAGQAVDGEPYTNGAADEILDITAVLKQYGFAFRDLTECSPKSKKTKESCAAAVRYILDHKEELTDMRRSGKLAIRSLAKGAGVNKKLLERHRKYIIAVSEILAGDYPVMKEYLGFIYSETGDMG